MGVIKFALVFLMLLAALAGCETFGGPPKVTLLRSDVERAQVRGAYLLGKVEQWAATKCAAKELTSAECRAARDLAAGIKAWHATVQGQLDKGQAVDLGAYLGLVETVLPYLLAL